MKGTHDRGPASEPPANRDFFSRPSNHRHHSIIHSYSHRKKQLPVLDLIEHIAAQELDEEIDKSTHPERKQVSTFSQQTYLETIGDTDVVSDGSGSAQLKGYDSELANCLDIIPGSSIRWSGYYFALSVSGVAGLGSLAIGILQTGTLQAMRWATLGVDLFADSAAAHGHRSHQPHCTTLEALP